VHIRKSKATTSGPSTFNRLASLQCMTTQGSKRASDKFTLFFLGESAVAIRDTVFEAIWSFLPPVFSTDFIDGVEKEATATLKQLFSSLSISDMPCDAQGDLTSQLNEIESAMLSTLGNLNVLVSGQGRGGLAVECDKTAPQETEVCSDARHARGLGWPVLRCGGTQEALNGVETALDALEGQLALTPARADRAFEFNEERARAARRVTSTSSKSMSFTSHFNKQQVDVIRSEASSNSAEWTCQRSCS
jgi:hypothetical protein